jgi:hypothetical protein
VYEINLAYQPSDKFETIENTKSTSDRDKIYLTFSFRYWKQHNDYFGLGSCSASHFASFLSALQELGTHTVDEFNNNSELKKSYHYHWIKWNAEGVNPRKNGKSALDISDEFFGPDYSWYQFAITTGTGRFAGFYDENTVFQVVVVDINHNLQPAKINNYQIQKTRIHGTPYDKLNVLVTATKNRIQKECPTCPHLKSLSEHDENIYISIEADLFEVINTYVQNNNYLDFNEALTDLAIYAMEKCTDSLVEGL